ncbi:hypothetical protein AcV5_000416 [Taiwanofungus camphoratus]|nr:hypothetical protein AcV7_003609 [Antrodia cinnamomea]KAI0938814.1 hypothetical protein AcV5_000416 [Antrodia cinnamomea]
MTTLLPTFIGHDSGSIPEPDIEPDIDWKNGIRRQIEDGMQHMVNGARTRRDEQLSQYVMDPVRKDEITREYMDTMSTFRRLAHEQYMGLLERERQQRRWTTGKKLDDIWSEALVREQQGLLDAIQRKGSTREPDGTSVTGTFHEQIEDMAGPSRADDGERPPNSHQSVRSEHIKFSNPTRSSYLSRALAESAASFDDGSEASSSHTMMSDSDIAQLGRRQSASSVSMGSTSEVWRPAVQYRPHDMPGFSKAFAHATAMAEPDVSPFSQDSPASGVSRRVSRSNSIRSNVGLQPEEDVDVASYAHREKVEIHAAEEQWRPMTRAREKQRDTQGPQLRPQISASDFHSRRMDDRSQVLNPMFSSSSQYPRTPDSPYSSRPSPGASGYFPDTSEPVGTPIRSSSRIVSTPQGSPEDMRYQQANMNAGRTLIPKTSFTVDNDIRQSQSPTTRRYHSPHGAPITPVAGASGPIPLRRSFIVDDDTRQPQSSPNTQDLYGSGSLPRSTRRDSIGGRSLRSQSSRQEFRVRTDADVIDRRRLPTYDEQSLDSDEFDSDGEDYGYDVEALDGRREEQVRQMEEEALRMAEEAERRAAEARRKEEEVRRQAEEAKRKEDEIRRKEVEVRRKEQEAKRKEEEARRKEQEVREEARRRDEEFRRREEELRKREEEVQRKEREAKLKEEQRLKEEQKLKDEQRLKEEQRLREERRLKEEQRQREEQRLMEEQRVKTQDDFRRQQEELWRRAEERKRQDSIDSLDSSRPTISPRSSTSSSGPWPIPGRSGSTTSNASTDRSSTASSSFGSSPSSAWSASGRSNTSTNTQASGSGRTSSTPTSSAKPNPGGWKTTSSVPAATPSNNYKPSASPSNSGVTAEEEEAWKRRQKEQARKQQEQFQRMQEQAERERQAKTVKQLTKEEVVQLFEEHERRWTRLTAMDVLSWHTFPWPMLKTPESPEDLTTIAISAYIFSPHYPGDKSKSDKDRIKDHIKRWHPDRFETKLLPKVREDDREKVKQGAGLVARNLNELLTRSSNANDFFS